MSTDPGLPGAAQRPGGGQSLLVSATATLCAWSLWGGAGSPHLRRSPSATTFGDPSLPGTHSCWRSHEARLSSVKCKLIAATQCRVYQQAGRAGRVSVHTPASSQGHSRTPSTHDMRLMWPHGALPVTGAQLEKRGRDETIKLKMFFLPEWDSCSLVIGEMNLDV